MSREAAAVTLAFGTTLSCVVQGDPSGPALVLLAGPTDSWTSYQLVLVRLPPSIRAIAVSQRGHGDSDKPATGYGVADFAADAVALLDALQLERAVLAGHSGSCLVARRVAIDRPERVAGLVLEASPTTLRGHPALEAFVESTVSGLEDPIDRGAARSLVVGTSSENLPREFAERLVDEVLKVPAHVWREMFGELLRYDDTAELARVTAPVLMIWGDADQLIDREMQEQLLRQMPSAELMVYHDVGHTPRWDDPAQFAADVSKFLERKELGA